MKTAKARPDPGQTFEGLESLRGASLKEALLRIKNHLARHFSMRGYQGAPGLDARRILSHALKLSAEDLICQEQRLLDGGEASRTAALAARRGRGEPLARLVGRAEFWGLPIILGPETLIPRPDSEVLVEAVLSVIKRSAYKQNQPLRLLDVGTGSGCLGLAVASECPNATVLGVDISMGALNTAQKNAEKLGLEERFFTKRSNLLNAIGKPGDESYPGPFDVIFSNPPYIPSQNIAFLSEEVRDFDPPLALDGGQDGLAFYRRLIPAALWHLKKEGALVVEIGFDQAEAVCRLMEAHGLESALIRDLAGNSRAVTARREPPPKGKAYAMKYTKNG